MKHLTWIVLSALLFSCGGTDEEFLGQPSDDMAEDAVNAEQFAGGVLPACDCPLPLAPSGLWSYVGDSDTTTETSDKTTLTLKWTNGDEGTTRTLQVKSGNAWTNVATLSAAGTSYARTNRTANATYTHRIKASNNCGISYSNETSTTMSVPISPSTIYIMRGGTDRLTLRWRKPSNNVKSFRIYRSSASGGTYTQITEIDGNKTTYTNTGRSANTSYYYKVRAYNAYGNSSYSPAVGTSTGGNSMPAAPTILKATAVGATTGVVSLEWFDNANNESNYVVQRGTAQYGPFTTLATLEAGAESYNATGHVSGTTYYFLVFAKNTAGGSSPRAALSVPYKAPTNIPHTLTESNVTNAAATLEWADTATTNENGYKIEVSTDGTSYNQIGTAERDAVSFNANELMAGTAYWWRVRSYNGLGNGPYSHAGCFTTEEGSGPCPDGGAFVGEYCWYLGNFGESCDTVCSGVSTGGYICNISGTRDYAGSGGTNQNCDSVLTALGVPAGSMLSPSSDSTGCVNNSLDSRIRFTMETVCNSSHESDRRACACYIAF